MSRSTSALLFLVACAAFGCNDYKNQQESTLSHYEKSALKPTVAFVPVIDNTKNDLPWSLSEEFTTEIASKLQQDQNIYIQDFEKTYNTLKKTKLACNPFGNEIDWIKETFTEEDFVVFLEIVEHEEILRQDKKKPINPSLCSSDLNIALRVRVFDLRGSKPCVVLQELLHETHFIPTPFTYVNFYQSSWKEDAFTISPTGLAHTKLYKEAAQRIKEYILL